MVAVLAAMAARMSTNATSRLAGQWAPLDVPKLRPVMAIARTCTCGRKITDASSRCGRCSGGRLQSCSECGVQCRGPYCPDHEFIRQQRTEEQRRARQPWRAWYQLRSYYRGRAKAIKRANGACEKCGRTDLPLQCDHIISLRTARNEAEADALNDPANLQMLCSGPGSCHETKTFNRG